MGFTPANRESSAVQAGPLPSSVGPSFILASQAPPAPSGFPQPEAELQAAPPTMQVPKSQIKKAGLNRNGGHGGEDIVGIGARGGDLTIISWNHNQPEAATNEAQPPQGGRGIRGGRSSRGGRGRGGAT